MGVGLKVYMYTPDYEMRLESGPLAIFLGAQILAEAQGTLFLGAPDFF
jgi:hypothetical protein